jgi:arabinose-5-phosphate isomerase
MKKYFKSQINSLIYTFNKLGDNNDLYNNIYKTVENKGKIIISGLGKNVAVAEKFVGTLNSIGINSAFMHTNSAMHGDMGIINEKDFVILLSKSGNTEETYLLANHLIYIGISYACISFGNENSKLFLIKPKSFIQLYLINEGDQWNLLPINSTLSYLAYLQSIALQLIEDLKIDVKVLKRNHPGGAIGEVFKKK